MPWASLVAVNQVDLVIPNIGLDELKVVAYLGTHDVSTFDLRMIKVIEIIDTDNQLTVVQKPLT